jgi:hypothetical protein
MKFYLAARYGRRLELCEYRDELLRRGHEVVSRWLDGAHASAGYDLRSEASIEDQTRYAIEEWGDLLSADVVISFTEPAPLKPSRGGRHAEFGAAVASRKWCIVVGPRENIFHCLPQIQWFEAFDDLTRCWDTMPDFRRFAAG